MRGLPAASDTEGTSAGVVMRRSHSVPRGKEGMEAGLSIRGGTLVRKHVCALWFLDICRQGIDNQLLLVSSISRR
jgi:hypothetical protein